MAIFYPFFGNGCRKKVRTLKIKKVDDKPMVIHTKMTNCSRKIKFFLWYIKSWMSMEKYYKDLLKMPAVKSTKNPDGTGTITESTVNEIHKVLRSCFRQAVKWDMMEKNPAVDATVPKAKKQEREICATYIIGKDNEGIIR